MNGVPELCDAIAFSCHPPSTARIGTVPRSPASAASSWRWRRSGGARRTATGPTRRRDRTDSARGRSRRRAACAAAPREIHRGEMIERPRIPVRHVERDRIAKAPRDARLSGLVARSRDALQHRDGRQARRRCRPPDSWRRCGGDRRSAPSRRDRRPRDSPRRCAADRCPLAPT